MLISVIIPTYNEANNIGKLLERLNQMPSDVNTEIIVVDGGSGDETMNIAKTFGVEVYKSPRKGRAAQMNFGVKQSKGEVLQFIHADTLPPLSNFKDIQNAIETDFSVGCFTYCFDSKHPLLRINSFFTRFDKIWCRGGDQAIFVTRKAFDEVGGYRDDYLIMEDFDFIKKIQAKFPFRIVKNNCIVSARKYQNNSYLKVQLANLKIFRMYDEGASQELMTETYQKLLKKWD